jgi:homoserine acetyltransferase
MFANALLNANDKRSVRQLLELFKIKSPQYNAWLRDSAFQSYLRTRAEQIFESSDYEAYKALVRAVSNGDVNAIKFFFELRGIYNPKLTVNINIRSVMTEVIRVITDNVKDPQVIEVIATELERISDAS